jgi:hypothetical protein
MSESDSLTKREQEPEGLPALFAVLSASHSASQNPTKAVREVSYKLYKLHKAYAESAKILPK